MKQPVWVLNSSLLVLLCMSQLLLFMLQKAVPRRVSISPGQTQVDSQEALQIVDIESIYRNDLFDTYQAPIVSNQLSVDEVIAPIPKPPKIISAEIPIEKAPTFFAPLDVTLKGIIFVKDDPAKCIGIVQNKKTKEERNYQVGDLIEDAQILKILSNRIIIIRSNGQQETLYLREEDAVQDFNAEVQSVGAHCVKSISDTRYSIDVTEFKKKIRNLGEFITLLDLTTVYKDGKSFGCRVGKVEKDSLGDQMGLVVNDIIIKIDDYLVDDLANRIKLYDHICQQAGGDMITVVLYRNGDTLTHWYALVDSLVKEVTFSSQAAEQVLMNQLSKDNHAVEKTAQALQQGFQEEDDKDQEGDEVVIQSVTNPLQGVDLYERNEESAEQKTDEAWNNVTYPDKNAGEFIPLLSQETLNQLDAHRQRMMEEREKMIPALKEMKFQDRNNMLRQSSRNVILNNGIK
jgi:type II secretory pathway component PulC